MTRLLVVGLDGGTLDLVQPWAAQGLLPTFARLMEQGASGPLRSTIPPVTAPAFVSFMTGMNPGKTGVFNFIEPMPGSYEMRYVNASARRGKSVWRMLGDAGVSVGVVDVPITYPPEDVNGYMIAGVDAPDEKSAFTFPPALHQRLAEEFGREYLSFASMQTLSNSGKTRGEFLLDEWRAIEQRTRLTQFLMREHPTDVCMLLFKATDHVQHLFWHLMDPRHPRHDAREARDFGDAILKTYQKIDECVAWLLQGVSPDTEVIVMSDHGFGPGSDRVVYLNNCLAKVGLLRYKDPGVGRLGVRRVLQGLAGGLHRTLQRRMPPEINVALARAFPWARRRLDFHRAALSAVDWRRTRAYAVEILASAGPGIWVNLEGRQPQGVVPAGDYERMLETIEHELSGLRDPVSGEQLIPRLHRRDAVYHGPHTHLAPDLTPAIWEGETFVCKASVPGGDVAGREPARPSTGAGWRAWTGSHRMHGMFIGHGGRFRPTRLDGGDIVDLAPTMLHLMGVAVPEGMDGRVLVEALDEGFLKAHPVRFGKADGGADEPRRTDEAYTEEEARKVEEKLRALGYVE